MTRRQLLIININPSPRTLEGCRAIEGRLRELDPRLEIATEHWRRVLRGGLASHHLAGVVLGPNDTPFPAYPPEFDAFLSLLRARRGPTLGICGGHQALALAHGAPIAPVYRVPAATESYAGMPKVSGQTLIRTLGDPDPLLVGLADEVIVHASHVDEVKEVPPGFRLLAIGDPCHVQVMRADRRPLWGVQFHPERPTPGDAGGVLLANFLALLRGR